MVTVVADKESVTATEDADVAATTEVTTGDDTEVVDTVDAATVEAVILGADTVLALFTVVTELVDDC